MVLSSVSLAEVEGNDSNATANDRTVQEDPQTPNKSTTFFTPYSQPQSPPQNRKGNRTEQKDMLSHLLFLGVAQGALVCAFVFCGRLEVLRLQAMKQNFYCTVRKLQSGGLWEI